MDTVGWYLGGQRGNGHLAPKAAARGKVKGGCLRLRATKGVGGGRRPTHPKGLSTRTGGGHLVARFSALARRPAGANRGSGDGGAASAGSLRGHLCRFSMTRGSDWRPTFGHAAPKRFYQQGAPLTAGLGELPGAPEPPRGGRVPPGRLSVTHRRRPFPPMIVAVTSSAEAVGSRPERRAGAPRRRLLGAPSAGSHGGGGGEGPVPAGHAGADAGRRPIAGKGAGGGPRAGSALPAGPRPLQRAGRRRLPGHLLQRAAPGRAREGRGGAAGEREGPG